MATASGRLILWSPRVLGVLVSAFIAAFALDAFGPATPLLTALPDFFVHLIPAVVLLGIVVASFRRPWIGAMAFIGLAIAYALFVPTGRLDWTLVISGPLIVVGVLFLWSWRVRRVA